MGDLTPDNLREFLNAFLTKSGISFKTEEVSVLVNKFAVDSRSSIRVSDVIAFCNNEYERLQWAIVGKRFRNIAQKAAITGLDVEQLLSDRDKEGDGYVTTRDFKSFIEKLAEFGRLRLQDINMICKYFARRPADNEPMREPVSIKEVMAFLGKEYVGNLNLRLRDAIIYARIDASGGDKSKAPRTSSEIVRIFKKYASGATDMSRAAITSDIESALRDMDVYNSLSHEQVRMVVNKALNAAVESGSKPSFGALLRFLDIEHSDERVERGRNEGVNQGSPNQVITAEYLMRQLLELTTKSGVAFDEAFRHFDSDGNGSISPDEFIAALDELHIFSNIENWKEQIGSIIGKFDTTGDGSISLVEFFHMFDAKLDYSPNIVQRMTKIFAVAVDNGMNFESIFADFDKDGDGKVTVVELYECLKALGTFNEISQEDASKTLNLFDKSGDGNISLDEFKDFFLKRVQHAQIERRDRLNRRSVRQFIDLMASAMEKGLTSAQVFKHFDKDNSGKVSVDELTAGLRDLPQFKSLTNNEVAAIVGAIDNGKKNSITKEEFEAFIASQVKRIDRGGDAPSAPEPSVTEKFILLMNAAMKKGLSAAKLFAHFDKDGTGTITVRELSDGLRGLPQFKSLSDADVKALISSIDKDRNGSISLTEFERFVSQGSAQLNREFVDRVHKIFRKVLSKGISIDQLFAHIDKDKSGSASAREIEDALIKTSAFNDLKPAEIERLIAIMDYDGDEMISIGEFKQFVESGEIPSKPRAVATTSPRQVKSAQPAMGELLLRHLRRISEPDGGIAGLLAYLDRDEDGEISVLSFMKMLRREGVLNSMDESDILEFIKPAMSKSAVRSERRDAKGADDAKGSGESKRDGLDRGSANRRRDRDRTVAESKSDDVEGERIRIVPLLHLLDGTMSDATSKLDSAKKDLEEDELVERALPEYTFSNDPEIRTIEKKLRNVGHTLARRGFDIESLFRKFDASNSGSIRRTDFLEILSQMGLYILEQGKSLEAANGANEVVSQQERQVARIRGSDASASQSLASARKYVKAYGDVDGRSNVADFQVGTLTICVVVIN
jgi:Ca2+-binding EF-hand superfamily protein